MNTEPAPSPITDDATKDQQDEQDQEAPKIDEARKPRSRLRRLGERFATDLAEGIGDRLGHALAESLAFQEGRVVDLREVTRHLINNRPPDRPDLRGFLLREKTLTGWVFHIGFVPHPEPSGDHAPVATEKIHARRCDEELDSLFDGKNVILFA